MIVTIDASKSMAYWRKVSVPQSMAVHAVLGTVMPMSFFVLIAWAAGMPELRSFALRHVAPWTVPASLVAVSFWLWLGCTGRLTHPPRLLAHVLGIALATALAIAATAGLLVTFVADGFSSGVMLDGGICGLVSGFMSGLTFRRQTRQAVSIGHMS